MSACVCVSVWLLLGPEDASNFRRHTLTKVCQKMLGPGTQGTCYVGGWTREHVNASVTRSAYISSEIWFCKKKNERKKEKRVKEKSAICAAIQAADFERHVVRSSRMFSVSIPGCYFLILPVIWILKACLCT